MLPILIALAPLATLAGDFTALVAPDLVVPGGEQPRFGAALARDAGWLAVGAPDALRPRPQAGAVVLWRRAAAGWSRACVLEGDGRAQARFGAAVDLQGECLAVGAYFADGPQPRTGAVHLFDGREGWTQAGRLVAADAEEFDGFGWSLALDGDRLLVGAPFASRAGFQSGCAYIFRRVGGQWIEEAALGPEGLAAFDHLGWSVAWADGRALIGAPDADLAGEGAGAVFVFERRRGRWVEGPTLTDASLGAGAALGQSLAGDRARVVAGAPGANTVKIWRRRARAFEQEATLAGAPCSRFGAAVAISRLQLAVGAPLAGGAGALHVFRRRAHRWSPAGLMLGEPGSELGAALTADVHGGEATFLAGAPLGEGGCPRACMAGRVVGLR